MIMTGTSGVSSLGRGVHPMLGSSWDAQSIGVYGSIVLMSMIARIVLFIAVDWGIVGVVADFVHNIIV